MTHNSGERPGPLQEEQWVSLQEGRWFAPQEQHYLLLGVDMSLGTGQHP